MATAITAPHVELTPEYTPVFDEFDGSPNAFCLPLASVSRIECISEERKLVAIWTESLQSYMLDLSHSGQDPLKVVGSLRPFIFDKNSIFAYLYQPAHLQNLHHLANASTKQHQHQQDRQDQQQQKKDEAEE